MTLCFSITSASKMRFIVSFVSLIIGFLGIHAQACEQKGTLPPSSGYQPLCRRPRLGCNSMGDDEDDCERWSGCEFVQATQKCVKRGCDEMLCEIRNLAYELSVRILPSCVRNMADKCLEEQDEVNAALKLGNECGLRDRPVPSLPIKQSHYVMDQVNNYVDGRTFFVSPAGSDSNPGKSRTKPLSTIQAAVQKTRGLTPNGSKMIVLMKGKHRLTEPVAFTQEDNNLVIQGETGAVVSGAISLDGVHWTKEEGSTDIYSATIPPAILSRLGVLSILSYDEEPGIRARYPNIDRFTDFNFIPKRQGISRFIARKRPIPYTISRVKVMDDPSLTRYRRHILGKGGDCQGVFTPPIGYFCDPKTDADVLCPFATIGAIELNLNYLGMLKPETWSRRSSGYFHMGHKLKWGGWTYKLSSNFDPKKPRIVQMETGGFQEARGSCRRGGTDWFLDNFPEFLDHPNEFFLDIDHGVIRFRLPVNVSQPPDLSNMEIGSNLTRLFEIIGTSAQSPVQGIQVRNIEFERTYPVHMLPHETPSGGDWAIHRSGTVFVENAVGIAIEDCRFQKLGSHGIFFSKHVQQSTILRNKFFGIDATAIAMVGDPKLEATDSWDRRNDDDHIEQIVIKNNMIRDVGLMNLQGAGIFGSITKDILVEHNCIFNGPRAGVVYNDLYGNGMVTRENILFELVRQTMDHGPYNTWDRQQWLQSPGFKARPNVVERNYIIGTEGGPKLVDMDDGSRMHEIHENVIAYGYMKFKGGREYATNNIVVAFLPSQASCAYFATSHYNAASFVWENNTCFTPKSGRKIHPYSWAPRSRKYCIENQVSTANNGFYGSTRKFDRCATNLPTWQYKNGQDKDSIFAGARPVAAVIQACRDLMAPFAT